MRPCGMNFILLSQGFFILNCRKKFIFTLKNNSQDFLRY
mgnify:CR=1 FL=1